MVIAKPISPAALYDRLSWVALNRRQFVDAPSYFGPDRRFKIKGYTGGVGRRKGDNEVEIADESGPPLGQNDFDSLFASARSGRS
jgi:two-component system chemotaxis response regulator CheY